MVFHELVFLLCLPKTIFFLGKRWCFCPKPGKSWFSWQNHLFPRENQKAIILESGRIVSQKNVFLGFLVFPRKKLVFLPKTIFILGKSWFFTPNHLFPRKKLVFLSKTIFFPGKAKNTIFLDSGRIVSQQMLFLVFFWFSLGKSWFSFPKPCFSWEKVGFSRQNHLFPGKSRYFTSRPSVCKQKSVHFICCLRALYELVLSIRFHCQHYCDSSPLSVSTIQ